MVCNQRPFMVKLIFYMFMQTVWAVFNLLFVVIFGGLHQAGIIPIMQKLQNQALGFRNCEEIYGYFQCELGKKIIRPGINTMISH